MNLKEKIRNVQDFPKEGIGFKDITTLLKDGDALRYAIKEIAKNIEEKKVDLIVGPEARGFIVGTPVAYELGIGFVPVRKPGKLPSEVLSYEYSLEYGSDTLEMHKDAIRPGMRVAIVDDLLATGGTTAAVTKMVEKLGGKVVSIEFLMELDFLDGRKYLEGYEVNSLIHYTE